MTSDHSIDRSCGLPPGGVAPNDTAAASLVDRWLHTYATTRDLQLRERIVLAYLGMADRLATRYAGSHGAALEDLCQVARTALLAAVDRFDPGRGESFLPYGVACVVGELKRYLRDVTWTVRVSRPLQERALEACRATNELFGQLHRSPTMGEVAERLGTSLEEVVEAIEAARTRFQISLDQPLREGGQATLGDLLPDTSQHEELENLLLLPDLVKRLPEPERQAIQETFIHELNQDEIARHLGCSQMQVSRLLRRALQRLRCWLFVPDPVHDPPPHPGST